MTAEHFPSKPGTSCFSRAIGDENPVTTTRLRRPGAGWGDHRPVHLRVGQRPVRPRVPVAPPRWAAVIPPRRAALRVPPGGPAGGDPPCHPAPGEELGEAGPLTRTRIVQYAGASGDYNPLHTDEVFATEVAGYPSVFAHGMLTMGMTGRILTDYFGDGRLTRFGGRFSAQV